MSNIKKNEALVNLKTKKYAQKEKQLKKIVQISEESATIKKHNIESERYTEKKIEGKQRSFPKFFQCLKRILYQWILKKDQNSINIQESQMSSVISKIRRKQERVDIILPPKTSQTRKKRTLVLDLDETLIFTEFKQPQKFDFELEIEDNGKVSTAFVVKRFGLEAFLFEMSQLYEIVIFSASKRVYIDSVLTQIDPKKRISHVVSIQNCISVNNNYYLKPLKILGRSMRDIVFIDDNRMSGILYPENFHKIESFRGCQKDRKLIKLGSFLKYLSQQQDIIPVSLSKRTFDNLEIKIGEQPIKSKIKLKHKKTKSEVHLMEKDEASNTELCKENSP